MPILILILTLGIKKLYITIISANAYCAACKSKRAWVFAVFIKNLEYQAKKKARLKTNSRNIITKKYHNLLDIIFKKNFAIFSSYQKYDNKIILKK